VASRVVPTGPAEQAAALTDGATIVLVPMSLGAVAAIALAWRRRERAVLWLAGIALAWAALLALMILDGYPPEARFFALPAGLWCIVGAVGIAWLAQAVPSARLRPAIATGLAALVLPFAVARGHHSFDEAADAVDRAQLEGQLRTVVDRARADRAEPMLPERLAWMKGEVAWELDLPLRAVREAHTSDAVYLKRLEDPDTDPLPSFPTDAAIVVRRARSGELLLEPFGNSRIRLAHGGEPLHTVARSGRWRAIRLG
jgi:hypothetical protein